MSWFAKQLLQSPDLPWIAVRTRVRSEKQVARILAAHGVTVWAGTAKIRQRWSDRWKAVEWPLFPGYMFARVPADGWYPLLNISGVHTVVKSGRLAATLDPALVADVQRYSAALGTVPAQPERIVWWHPGDLVLVTDGPFEGIRAVVTEVQGRHKVSVGMTLLGQGVTVTLPDSQLSRIPA